MGKEKKAGGP